MTHLKRGLPVGAPEIRIDQSGFSRWKNCTVLTSLYVNRKGIEIGTRFSLETARTFKKKDLQFQHHIKLQKVKNLNLKYSVSKLLIWRQKWVARVQQLAHSSLSVARWGNNCIILDKICQIKPRILELRIRRCQSNFSIVFTFV